MLVHIFLAWMKKPMMLYRTNPGRSVGVWTAASDIVSQAPRKSEKDEEGFSRCVSDHCIHEVLYPEIVTSPPFSVVNGPFFTREYSFRPGC